MAEVRLQKYMAECGVASRRACEALITAGHVCVNGVVADVLGCKVDPERDTVTVDGQPIGQVEKRYYILLNKPRGYVTTAKDEFGRPTVMELVSDIHARLYPVGRLDYDSEGLLLLTNDGDFAYRLTHPKHQVKKTYHALVRGHVTREELALLRRGVLLDTGMTAPAQAEVLKDREGSCVVQITIAEGKNRQVRKMCESIGHNVIALRRVGEGSLRLGNLPVGKWRHLTKEEIAALERG